MQCQAEYGSVFFYEKFWTWGGITLIVQDNYVLFFLMLLGARWNIKAGELSEKLDHRMELGGSGVAKWEFKNLAK